MPQNKNSTCITCPSQKIYKADRCIDCYRPFIKSIREQLRSKMRAMRRRMKLKEV